MNTIEQAGVPFEGAEPEAIQRWKSSPMMTAPEAAVISTAISLKRIADVMAGDETRVDLVNGIMQAIGDGIRSTR